MFFGFLLILNDVSVFLDGCIITVVNLAICLLICSPKGFGFCTYFIDCFACYCCNFLSVSFLYFVANVNLDFRYICGFPPFGDWVLRASVIFFLTAFLSFSCSWIHHFLSLSLWSWFLLFLLFLWIIFWLCSRVCHSHVVVVLVSLIFWLNLFLSSMLLYESLLPLILNVPSSPTLISVALALFAFLV